jgi:hypothetical protein
MAYSPDRPSPFNVSPRLVVGIGLVVFGGILLLGRVAFIDVESVLRLWPLILIALGLQQFFNPRTGPAGERSFPVNGVIWMAIGGVLLLNSLGILRASIWELFWPAVLIALGVRLMSHSTPRMRDGHRMSFDGGFHGGPSGATATGTASFGGDASTASSMGQGAATGAGAAFDEAESADAGAIFAVLSAVKRVSAAVPFHGAEVTAFLGGAHMDLRRAILPPGGEAVLDLFIVVGGCELIVPPHWIVSAPLVAVMGGVDDKRLVQPPPIIEEGQAAAPPRLVIRGFVMMGGITIRS